MRMLTMTACLVLAASFTAHAQAGPGQTASNPLAAQQQATLQQATPPATSPKNDPQEEADIRQLLELTGVAAVGLQAVHAGEENTRALVIRSLPPGAYREKLVTLFFQKFNSKINAQSFYDLIIPIYERNFTDEDIKGLIRFEETPLGQKYLKAMPEVLAEVHAAASPWGEKLGRESMIEVLAEHPELLKQLKEARAGALGH